MGSRTAPLGNSASTSECDALAGPDAGNALQQTLDGHRPRLAALDDRLNDAGRQVSKSQNAADVRLVELKPAGDLCRAGIFSAAKVSHP